MKPNQLATLVLRLMGIYCLVQVIPAISAAGNAVYFVRAPSANGSEHTLANIVILLGVLIPIVLRIVFGILLLVFSKAWGERLLPKETTQENIAAISFEQVQVLAFAIAGILIFAAALPLLFWSVYNLVEMFGMQSRYQNPPSDYIWREGLPALGTLAKALLGLALFFCAHGFANFRRSFQNFGTPKLPPEG